jgi:hypothetical protein
VHQRKLKPNFQDKAHQKELDKDLDRQGKLKPGPHLLSHGNFRRRLRAAQTNFRGGPCINEDKAHQKELN